MDFLKNLQSEKIDDSSGEITLNRFSSHTPQPKKNSKVNYSTLEHQFDNLLKKQKPKAMIFGVN
jgi:hypothetical protein